MIKAQHEGLISHEVFNNVQQIIDGKPRLPLKYNSIVEEFAVEGGVRCPRCGKNMTGSASKGRHGGKFFLLPLRIRLP